MWFPSIRALWRSRSTRPQAARRLPTSRRLSVEALEDRSVPAFLAPVTSAGGGFNLTVADFNHDGRADVAVVGGSNNNNYSVTVSLSKGDGTFTKASSTTLNPGVQTLNTFTIQDVNGDGYWWS